MKKERIFWGLFFILAAVLVILDRFSFFADISIIRLLITIALALWLFRSIIRRSMTGILFSIALLLICYDDVLPLEPLTPATLLLAAALGSIGFYFLLPRRTAHGEQERADTIQESVNDTCVHLRTTMGSGIKYVSSDAFQRADIECSMGTMKVYFDNAHIARESAVIHISAMMCGIELYVPSTWGISIDCAQLLSGIQESGNQGIKGEKQVRIEGKASLSGIKIIYI